MKEEESVREVDNRNPAEVISFLEAQVHALQVRNAQLEWELEKALRLCREDHP